ncbi:unnamed protein product [Prunus brigantina]
MARVQAHMMNSCIPKLVGVHPFCVCSYDKRVKFPIALKTIDWSTSQLYLIELFLDRTAFYKT